MRRAAGPLIGLVAGAVAGALWGWFGSGGYEANDSMLGTGFLGALAGLLIGTVIATLVDRRRR
jgi:membrane associated rhomboid family serine protease